MSDESAPNLDLVVVGAGPAGEKGAAQAAYAKKRVAIVERAETLGGIAVSSAGIPTKTLREMALFVSGTGKRALGGSTLPPPPADALERILSRTVEVASLMTRSVERNLTRHGVEVVRGSARLGPNHSVVISLPDGRERVLEPHVVLIATGGLPVHPSGFPFDDPDVHDSDSITRIDRIPNTLAVVGGGAVGCEMASIFAALGVTVTLIDGKPQILSAFDREIAIGLAESLNLGGVRLWLGSPVSAVRRAPAAAAIQVELESGRVLEVEKVLVAVGRRGDTEGLGLDQAGVRVDQHGNVVVDADYRTSAPGIYAAGDVIGPPGLASTSMEQARVAICRAFDIPFKLAVDALGPRCTFSIPEVATVGMTEQEVKDAGIEYEVGRAAFNTNTKARIEGATDGLVKLIFRRDDRVLIGVHILGDLATELIHIGQFVMHEGGTIDRFIHATFAVPTRADAYKYAAYDGLGRLEKRTSVRPA